MDDLKKEVVGAWHPTKRMVWRCRLKPRSRKHQHKLTLAERTERLAWAGGNSCPRCSFYGEECIAAWLREHGYAYVREKVFSTWDATAWRYDFELPALRVVLEVDGEQHFRRVNRKWTAPAEQQERDRQKTARALVHGYHCVRIPQQVVVRAAWQQTLEVLLQQLAASQEPTCYVVIAEGNDVYTWLE